MRLWLAARVNARWPHVASFLTLGAEDYLKDLERRLAPEPCPEPPEPEPAPSRGKPGSRPEDLEGLDPYGFRRGPSW